MKLKYLLMGMVSILNQCFDPAIQSLIERVQNVYPDFSIYSARWLDGGQNNDVIAFNDSWIFRFPRYKLGAINLKNEVTILRILKELLPLEIPFPQYVHMEPDNIAQSFTGYRMISGIPFKREREKLINTDELSMVASQLDDFLHALHTLSISKEIANVIQVTDTLGYWSDMFERIQRLLFPHMRPKACDQITHHFESFLQEAKNFNTTLIHGDFGSNNILVDESSKRVVAIVDFGSVTIGDPAVDYAAVSTIHPRMLELVVQRNPTVLEYTKRIEFYKGTFALQEALYGAETGDEKAFRSGLEQFV